MTDNKLLQQDEIDALLKAAGGNQDEPGTAVEQPGELVVNENTEGDISVEDVPGTGGKQGEVSGPENDMQLAAEDQPETEGAGQTNAPKLQDLTSEEKDALGEIGNISMGSAATTLSQLLNNRVLITSPQVKVTSKVDFLGNFNVPILVIKVEFKEGLTGHNVLVIKMHDAIVMANLMMGGDGTDVPDEISEMEISAAAEAMNQMIGTAATSLADLMETSVNIMPPETKLVLETDKMDVELPFDDPIVVISFKMNIENLLDTNIMQIIDLDKAREQAGILWKKFGMYDDEPVAEEQTLEELASLEEDVITDLPDSFLNDELLLGSDKIPGDSESYPEETGYSTSNKAEVPAISYSEMPQVDPEKLNLLLDIPLKVSVVLGRTRKSIKDVLSMTPGAIAELETLVDEPVDVLVNGKLVAKGEIVVVNENFGVKITNIISQRERIDTLRDR